MTSRLNRIIILSAAACALWFTLADAYASSTPELNRRAMAGLWRLTGNLAFESPVKETTTHVTAPMKEFTVYPKKIKQQQQLASPKSNSDYLLMLQEDGSFRQYGDRTEVQEEVDKLKEKLGTLEKEELRGTWDFLDGQLILAADRPEDAKERKVKDTILVGKVVATNQESLADHPVSLEETNTKENEEEKTQDHVDTHLSVPKGSVEVGKFFYPKNHPSFFEQPIFRPKPTGSFELRQVLGSLNTQNPEEVEEVSEKFTKDVFLDKKFFLTSHPLEKRRPKGNTRWSIKYNKFVEDPPKHQSQRDQEADEGAPVPIRVLEVVFFANNTFSTVAGLGGSTVLRGKWDVIGKEKDQLWMQVWRFGFGRSVSGSTFSEGMGLTQNDEKAYWGIINYEEDDVDQGDSDNVQPINAPTKETTRRNDRIQVKGSVLDGWGLEPDSVARFIMREATEMEFEEDEEEEDDVDGRLDRLFLQQDDDDEQDWSDSFQ